MSFAEILDMLGTAAFAISGGLAARHRQLDIFGVLIITFVTAIGGGTLRDIMIGNTPVAWMKDQQVISTVFVSYLLVLLFGRYFKRLTQTLSIFDAIGLGFATITGLQRGLDASLGPAVAVTLGMITGCFGGVIRDVLLNEIPLIFKKDIYASASLAGGLAFLLLSRFEVFAPVASTISIGLVVLIRLLAMRYRWQLVAL